MLMNARTAFAAANINLKCDEPPLPIKYSIVGPLKTVKFDPLTLPSFTQPHIRALNRKVRKSDAARECTPPTVDEKPAAKPPRGDLIYIENGGEIRRATDQDRTDTVARTRRISD
jgi:hypothetical protein